MKRFHCWDPDQGDADNGRGFDANHPEDAAEAYAEWAAYQAGKNGEGKTTVLVRLPGEQPVEVEVTGELDITYTSRVVEKAPVSRPTTAADLPGGALFVDMCRRAGCPITGLRLLSYVIEEGHAHERARDILSALMNRGDIRSMGTDPKCPAMQRGYLVGDMYEAVE